MMKRSTNKRNSMFLVFAAAVMTAGLAPLFLSLKASSSMTENLSVLDRESFVRKQPRKRTPSERPLFFNPLNETQNLLRHIADVSNESMPPSTRIKPANNSHQSAETWKESCAICFFGLPRSFQLLVLPSIIRNVLIPNKQNKCDIYMHYFQVGVEESGRSGYGGKINPDDVLLLKNAVKDVYNGNNMNQPMNELPYVSITNDTSESFFQKRGTLLEKYRSVKGKDGNYLYFPWMAKTYTFPTSIDNIVKQWHSIDAAWNDMERNSIHLHKNYTRVAMMRLDVVYVTPFNIYKIGVKDETMDINNHFAAVPNWARYPINDRMFYGPNKAVKIWATERFQRLEDHVLTYEEPGYGMHSERFLNHSIFPAIREIEGVEVVADPDICFLRARADGSTWINDCVTRNGAARGFRRIDVQALVEDIVGRTCRKSKFNARTIQIHCADLPANNTSP